LKVVTQARAHLRTIPPRELRLVLAAMALSALIVVAYVVATRPNGLEGDQREYHSAAVFFTEGNLFWSTLPFGVPHESMNKAPGYPFFSGVVYTVLGSSPTRLGILQGLVFAPLSVLAAWALARRLFDSRVAVLSAFGVALFPLAWEYFGLLYPEVLAIPLTTFLLWLFLEREPTRGLVVAVGLAMGVSLLIRPTAVFMFAGIAAAWIIAAGWRRGIGWTALTVAVAALVVAPWTARNMLIEDGGFVPISTQDAAGAGTFNDESASDPKFPYAWRPFLEDPPPVLEGPPVSDVVVREELQEATFDYIEEHPFSVVEAFYWNGLSRLWDIRRPAYAVDEAAFEGRSKVVTAVGMGIYYLVLPLALFGLWRMRSRATIVIPLLTMALAASVVFTVAAATRYRAPLEPLLMILAIAAVTGVAGRSRGASAVARPEEG
jgi:4-amino-4-deoxy-L-arabinose transferase-like glycosyltransferase